MPASFRWIAGIIIAAMILIVPFVHFRATYAHAKRLREVTPGRFYRCGQLTADGLREAIRRYGIKTVINFQHEDPDPPMPKNYYVSGSNTPESEICRRLGVEYHLLPFDLPTREQARHEPPQVIERFLKICDDSAAYPILIHCKAGLHRTGLLTAVYRIEYERWSVAEAVRELRANGFGDGAATTADDYVYAYLAMYQPRWLAKPVKVAGLGASNGLQTAREMAP
jgi:protein tyrosine phosphatase (PTP) superfamily phosphohydrolase (DUF442 family)